MKQYNYFNLLLSVAGHDGCWGEEEKYQAATMANKAAVKARGVECNRMKFIRAIKLIMSTAVMM